MAAETTEIGPEIVAATVTALGIVMAALVAAIYAIWEWHQKNSLERQRDRAIRAMSRHNFLSAVEADIQAELVSMELWFAKPNRDIYVERFKSYVRMHGSLGMPHSVSAPTMFEVGDFKSVLDVIPTGLMDPITSVYKQNAALNTILDEMKRGAYDKLTPERQEMLVEALFTLGAQTLESGKALLVKTKAYRRLETEKTRHPYSGAPVRHAEP